MAMNFGKFGEIQFRGYGNTDYYSDAYFSKKETLSAIMCILCQQDALKLSNSIPFHFEIVA